MQKSKSQKTADRIKKQDLAKSTKTVEAVKTEKTARKSWYPYGDLVASAAKSQDLPVSKFRAALQAFFLESRTLLQSGEIIVFAQFGSFTPRVVHAREMIVPSTGKKFIAPDRIRVKYKASSKVNELLDTIDVPAFERGEMGITRVIPEKIVRAKAELQNTEIEIDEAEL